MRDKPKVGQILYSLNIGNAARHKKQKLKEVEVKSIGRKYFKCGQIGVPGWQYVQYHLDGWYEKTDHIANSCLYEFPQEWEDEKESRKICELVREYFEYSWRARKYVSLSDLRKIKEIIDEKNK